MQYCLSQPHEVRHYTRASEKEGDNYQRAGWGEVQKEARLRDLEADQAGHHPDLPALVETGQSEQLAKLIKNISEKVYPYYRISPNFEALQSRPLQCRFFNARMPEKIVVDGLSLHFE